MLKLIAILLLLGATTWLAVRYSENFMKILRPNAVRETGVEKTELEKEEEIDAAIEAKDTDSNYAKEDSLSGKPVAVDVATIYKLVPNADNTEALMQLNADWKGAKKPFVRLNMQNLGEITYLNNQWLSGIDSFEIDLTGTTLKCISGRPLDVEKFPLLNTGIFFSKTPFGNADNTGIVFKSANKGESSVAVSDASKFEAGDKVYLQGYAEQFDGIPINPRFFEWKTVKAKKGNVLTFTQPLKWSYNENWKDVDVHEHGPYGKPRIHKLVNYCSYAKFVGGKLAKGPYARTEVPNAFMFKSEVLICLGVTVEGSVWPTENKIAKYINCNISGAEPDKNVALCEFNGGTIGGIWAATGVDSLVLKNLKVSAYCPLSPRVMYAENCLFRADGAPNLYTHPEYTFIEKVYLKNNTFSGGDPGLPHTTFWYSRKSFVSIAGSTSEIVTDDILAVKGIMQGTTITSDDGVKARVKDIVPNGEHWHIQLYSPVGNLKEGQVWTYNGEQKVVDLGGNKSANGRKIY